MKKKSKLAAKFGSRYGWGIKKKIIEIEEKAHKKYTCPECGRKNVKRISAGIWNCRKCKAKIAGGAYSLKTSATEIMDKILAKKKE